MRLPFFSQNTIGLDIADGSVEVVEVAAGEIIHKARRELAPGIVARGRIKDQDKLLEVVQEVLKESSIEEIASKQLVFGLPESQSFIHIFDTGEDKKNLTHAIKSELCSFVPLPCESIAYGFIIHPTDGDKSSRVVAVATGREVLEEWRVFLAKTGCTQIIIGVETFSCFIGLGVKDELLPVALVDIGSSSTMVSVYDASGVRFSSSVDHAGEFITKAAEATGIPHDEAERIKKQEGIRGPTENISAAFKQALDTIILDITESLRYCRDRHKIEVKNIIIIGGSSQMIGLVDYFKEKMGLEVSVGKYPYLPNEEGFFFGEAAGLALYTTTSSHFPVIDQGLVATKAEEDVVPTMVASRVDETQEESNEADDAVAKLARQKIILIVLVLVAIATIVVGLWYQSVQDKAHQEEIASALKNFSFVYAMPVSVSIAVDQSEQSSDRIKGRIIESKVQIAGEENEAVQTSRSVVSKQLSKEEALWNEPIFIKSSIVPKANISAGLEVREYTIKWLAYDTESTNALFTMRASDEMQKRDTQFSVSNIEKKGIKQTENPNVYILSGIVSVATDKQVEVPAAEAAVESSSSATISGDLDSVPPEAQMVTVLQTETGWLNVRREPVSSSGLVARIYPEETYEVLSDKDGWTQIQLDDGKTGWVAAKYLRKD